MTHKTHRRYTEIDRDTNTINQKKNRKCNKTGNRAYQANQPIQTLFSPIHESHMKVTTETNLQVTVTTIS